MLKNLLFLRFPILLLLLLTALTTILFIAPVNLNKFIPDPILSRLLSIIITLALIILTYKWSLQLLNGWWALLPPFLLTFSPFILNSYTNNAETASAFFYTLAVYFLINFIFKPNRLNLFLAGLSFGLAQTTGFPAFILIPYFLILISMFYIAGVKRDWLTTEPIARFKRFGLRGFKYFKSIIVIFIIGFLFAFIGYKYKFYISRTSGALEFACMECSPPGFLNYYYSNDSWKDLIKLKIINQTPITAFIKIYWPFIILTASAFIYSLINIIKSFRASKLKGFWDYLGTSFPEFSMIVFIIMYSLFIIFFTSGISPEKLIPILPMVYILTASGLKKLVNVL